MFDAFERVFPGTADEAEEGLTQQKTTVIGGVTAYGACKSGVFINIHIETITQYESYLIEENFFIKPVPKV